MTEQALDDHLTRYLGQGRREADVGGVEIWRHERPEFVTVATHGLAGQPVTAVYPQELVCSVEHGQDGAALFLVEATLKIIQENRRGVVNNQVIRNDQPLLARTDITGVLVSVHPLLDDFDVVFDADRKVLVELMTLIPLTSAEVAQSASDGVEALLDHFEATDPPLLDIQRASST
ncbi:suppressor of fused domain protein [Amycolatopsis sp. TRM77291]